MHNTSVTKFAYKKNTCIKSLEGIAFISYIDWNKNCLKQNILLEFVRTIFFTVLPSQKVFVHLTKKVIHLQNMNTKPSSKFLVTIMTYLGLNYSRHLPRHWFIEGVGVFGDDLSTYAMCNFFSFFWNCIPQLHLLRISKRLKLKRSDCTHCVDFFM